MTTHQPYQPSAAVHTVPLSTLLVDRDLMCMVLSMARLGINSKTPDAPIHIQPTSRDTNAGRGFEVIDGLYRIGAAFVAGHTHIDATLTFTAATPTTPNIRGAALRDDDEPTTYFDFANACPATATAPCPVCATCHYNACPSLFGGDPERPDCTHNAHLTAA